MKVQTATRITVPQSEPAEYKEDRRGAMLHGRGGRGGIRAKAELKCKRMPTSNMVVSSPLANLRKTEKPKAYCIATSSTTNIRSRCEEKMTYDDEDEEEEVERKMFRPKP